jgi:integrase/recombinase XerD
VSSLTLTDLSAPAILDFLEHLESKRGNSVRSRNARLCAIKSFFHIVGVRDPANLPLVSQILAIPSKKTQRGLITYLTKEEVDAILAAPDQATWGGSRDHALLLTLYNSGARASEITSLLCRQVTFGSHTFIHLHGKGRKDRTVPLWAQTARVLQVWFQKVESKPESVAFPSVRGGCLSADALDLLLQKAVDKGINRCPSLTKKRVTPHVFRHYAGFRTIPGELEFGLIGGSLTNIFPA